MGAGCSGRAGASGEGVGGAGGAGVLEGTPLSPSRIPERRGWGRRSPCPCPLSPSVVSRAPNGGRGRRGSPAPGGSVSCRWSHLPAAKPRRCPRCPYSARGPLPGGSRGCPLRAAAPGPWEPCFPAGRSGQGAGGAGERQLPLAGACPDLLRIPGIAAVLAAGLGVQVAAHTDTQTHTHIKIHKNSSQNLRGPSHTPG